MIFQLHKFGFSVISVVGMLFWLNKGLSVRVERTIFTSFTFKISAVYVEEHDI